MRRPHLPSDRVLNRRGLRWFVSLRRTLMMSLAQRRLCIVRRRQGIESLRYSNGMILPLSRLRTPERVDEEAEIFLRAYRPKPGDVIVDAGAGFGDELLVFAWLVGRKGHVIEIEAHPASFERLFTLCRLNHLRQVTCVQAALLDAPGTVYITDLPQTFANSVVTGDGTLPVPAVTLDDLLGRLEVPWVDFLKMNIEGAELRALRGFGTGLRRTRHLAIACHDFRADEGESDVFRTRDAVTSLLQSHGFEILDVLRGTDPWERDYVYARSRSAAGAGGT
jgi:FkbM family methyltransferase